MANTNTQSTQSKLQPQGSLTLDQLRNDPEYSFWLTKDYASIFGQLVNNAASIAQMVRAQYQTGKINKQANDYINSLAKTYTALYNQTVNTIKNQMTVIEQSYVSQTDADYTDATAALNEMLRRQDLTARLAMMTDDQLKQYTVDNGQGLIALPEYDQQQIIAELDKRGIELEKTQFRMAKANQYKNDPNWQQLAAMLKNAWVVQPKGSNTSLVYLQAESDGKGGFNININYVSVDILKKLVTMDKHTAADIVQRLDRGLSFLKGFSNELHPEKNISAAQFQSGLEYSRAFEKKNAKIKVADNDPRINQSSSHWSLIAMYNFLEERFGNDPAITNNPIYNDPMDPNYDIEKKYKMMMQLYNDQKATGHYYVLKLVDTHGQNPETMDNDELDKVFGKVD